MPEKLNPFQQSISDYLQGRGQADELFAETLKKPAKNIKDCCTYILNEVKRSNRQGFSDDEIFNMAVHYYDEDNIKVGEPVTNAKVVINRAIELTESDKELVKKAAEDNKKAAIAKAIAEATAKLTAKPVKKKAASTEEQTSLF